MTVLAGPDSACVAMMHKEMGMDDDSIGDCIAKLKEWLIKQPHLPSQASENLISSEFSKDIKYPYSGTKTPEILKYDAGSENERRLRRLLTCHKFSVERCKKTLDAYYSLRTSMPEFFRNRDPLGKKLQQAMDVVGIMPLPKCTPEGRRVSVLRILIPDASLTDGYEVAKFSMMCTDIRTLEDTSLGDIFVIDLNGISVGHLPIVNAIFLKKLEMLYRLAFATRVSAFHYVNAPKFVDMLVNILKSSFVPKLASRVRIHTRDDGFDELHKSVPPSILPSEYGGSAGKFNDLYDDWKKKVYEYRDWFLKEESVGVREDRRPSSNNLAKDYDIYGTQGTFRQLSID